MNPLEIQTLMVLVSLKMRALSNWVMQADLSREAMIFFDAYLITVARHADTIASITFDPNKQIIAGRRCIFY